MTETNKITIHFPSKYKNWKIIINAAETFLRVHGFTPFVTPTPNVTEFTSYPPLSRDMMSDLITHVALTIKAQCNEGDHKQITNEGNN